MSDRAHMINRIVDTTIDGIWVLDEHGRTVFANPGMARLLGRRADDGLEGLSVADFLDDEGKRQLPAHLANMNAGLPGAENLETLLVRSDGTVIWTLASWAPLHGDDGVRVGWLHRFTEDTERKQLMERLQDREHQLATAQRIAQIGSWEWDVPTDTVTWSDQLYRIYNLRPQEFAATYEGFLAFVHPDDRPRVRAHVESTFAGVDEFSFDARIIRTDGEQRWVRGLGLVERGPDGMPRKMGGTTQDITDLKTADELAAEATRRMELLQNMAMAANKASSLAEAVEVAASGLPAYTQWSAVCVYPMTPQGPSLPTVLPTAYAWTTPPDPRLAERARISRRLEVGPPTTHQDTHSLVAIPVQLGGVVVAVIEVLADEVPPDENSRFLIEQIAGQLSLVAERERSAAQLAEARDQAMEASRLKSEFLATMSHEIRTPMNGVIGLNDLMMRTELDDHQRRLAEGLQSAGLTLLGIINDILDLSKIESGKLELESTDFDVRAVFEQTAAVLSGPAHDKALELVVACQPDVPVFLKGDPVRFGQIVANLGSNAVKFTDSGEVVVQASVAEQSGDRVVLRVDVTDTGVGIAPGARERLFEAFTQADPSTTRRHGGTGLGLAISRQLVEALGGEISVTSELGSGSTFTFTASFARATTAPAARLSGPPHLLHDRRVLVVDDNETNRFILQEQLAAWQMKPVAVASADEALATLRTAARHGQPFEIALLDLIMPGTDGLELARRVSADPALGQLTMLLLSSDQGVGSQSARSAGIRAALSKPVRHSELYDTLIGVVAAALEQRPVPAPAQPELGVTVLVVEDNYVNQLVATGLLESLGCAVEVANDGAEAVEMLARPHRYAAVLMDCRMPRLDGFDATRAVRAHEPPGQRVPIIAMTASALEGERERCLAVGMDDFLTKPVDAKELERVIGSWIRSAAGRASSGLTGEAPAAAPTPAADGPVVPDVPSSSILDPDRMKMLDELKKDGVSFFERTAASFMARVGDQVVAIRDAADAGDAHGLMTSAHQLKGSALNLGLPLVGATAARLEAHGDAGRTDDTDDLLAELVGEVERAVAALQTATARAR
ncbi:response regulator [Nocardioides sp. KIGAM211]|uniref:Circadian input-output histidine kinase CikA n=1 Tax=Nocardioides luti TaxID=2761101 RepID=A0A7X0RHI4_9ACTN|nr:response regulator [Nocardioides luti]MBB6628426.1 response regulator [Nocardioides luti]